jgi:hypothetical protein
MDGLWDWPRTLLTVKEIQQILGILEYQRPFIKDFAALAWPLTALATPCTYEHPGTPWEKYNCVIHPIYIMIPAGPVRDQFFAPAPYIHFAINPLTGEPEILGTVLAGQT